MAIRFKSTGTCLLWPSDPYNSRYSCIQSGYIDDPIQDWGFQPPTLDGAYTIGGAAPTGKYIDVMFPELDLWNEGKYANYKFKVRVTYDNGNGWLTLQSQDLNGDTFTPNNIRSTRINYDFLALSSLPHGTYTANIIFEAYGIDESGAEHYVETQSTTFKLTVASGTGSNAVITDKKVYNLKYNKSSGVLSGDTVVSFYYTGVLYTVLATGNLKINDDLIGEFINDASGTKLLFTSVKPTISVGNYSDAIEFSLNNGSSNIVTINLEVVDDANDFDLSPKSFDFMVQKSPSEVKKGTVNITNPNNLQLSITAKPSYIDSAVINGNTLTFTTVKSSDLALGDYSGEIVVQSGSVTRKIAVKLKVLQALDSDFIGKSYYFALDPNKIVMQKTKPNAVYVKMKLDMYFKGFGEEYHEIQSYDYQYFNGKTEIYPGEEIQDFFIKCKDLDALKSPNFNYNLAFVNITITEHDDNDVQLSEFQINKLLFAPGKTPKCFPFYTDHQFRSCVKESVIRMSTDRITGKDALAAFGQKYQQAAQALSTAAEVVSMNFIRKDFIEQNTVLEAGDIKIIPVPDIDNPVHIFWENKNLVFDWFTAAKKNQKSVEYEHLFNADDDASEKHGTKKKKTFTLNTGWILREEIDLIDDLISSRICFILIDGKVIKAYPVSKKNELWDSEEYLFQMDLEFKILANEG